MVISVKRGYIRRSGWSAFAAALLLSAGCAIFHTDQYYRDLIYDDPDDYLAINSEINQEDIPFFERVVSLNPGLLNQDAGADGSLLDYALTH
ncbi:MAG: hypothetical protein ACRD22_18065, partial [Terriglobia bacterium]